MNDPYNLRGIGTGITTPPPGYEYKSWDSYCEKGKYDCLDSTCGCVDNVYYRTACARARGQSVPAALTNGLRYSVVFWLVVLVLGFIGYCACR
jgi:hypothetical protein